MHFSAKFILLGLVAASNAGIVKPRASSIEPDYFQTSFGPYAGPTKAGAAPFVAQSDLPYLGSNFYTPNTPVVTNVPISGNTDGSEIFKHMGNLSPYMPNPSGFGVNEYTLPPGANITQMHMIHRHGSRYPTSDASVATVGDRIKELLANGTHFTGDLSFLNDWTYQLGKEELTALGRQQLFDSGVLNWFNYGRLYDSSRPLIARTTTQVRMLQSAENFLNGFFGPNWTKNVTLEVVTESPGFNNSLAGDKKCTNHNNGKSSAGDEASSKWQEIYLENATERFRQSMTGGNPNWTYVDTFNLQTICPYETVGLGFSHFCSLFTWEEWLGFEYANDLSYYGGNGFASTTGRAVGVGYVEELIARLQQHYPHPDDISIAINETLDDSPTTFPLNQTLYLDFSHDTNIFSMMTAMGLTQFAEFLPTSGPPFNRQLIVSHIVPFAGRFNIEVIKAPRPVLAKRPRDSRNSAYDNGTETTYVHMVMNQRTIPLGRSISECAQRDDGWCELGAFIKAQKENIVKARFDESCFGNYSAPEYGSIKTGAI